MAQQNVAKSPWPKPHRQLLRYVRLRCESQYPLLKRGTTWWAAHTHNQAPRAVFNKSDDLWPLNCGSKEPLRLRYSFFRPVNNASQRNRESKVQAVMKHIEEKVPGIKFVRVDEDSEAAIRIAFNHKHPVGKTWSQVGRVAEGVGSGEPTMNLSDVTGQDSGEIQEGSDEFIDVIHEIFHSLGMHHEHQHPERNFTISETAVRNGMKNNGWSVKSIMDNVVRKLSYNEVGACSSPDNLSCMNYRIHPGWTKEGTEIKKSYKPSDVDWAFLNLLYPPRKQIQFERALSKCGISNLGEEDWGIIVGLYLEGDWGGVRSKIESVSNPKASKKGILSRLRTD